MPGTQTNHEDASLATGPVFGGCQAQRGGGLWRAVSRCSATESPKRAAANCSLRATPPQGSRSASLPARSRLRVRSLVTIVVDGGYPFQTPAGPPIADDQRATDPKRRFGEIPRPALLELAGATDSTMSRRALCGTGWNYSLVIWHQCRTMGRRGRANTLAPESGRPTPLSTHCGRSQQREADVRTPRYPGRSVYALSSFFNSFRNRRSVPCPMICCGLLLIAPTSCIRIAQKRRESTTSISRHCPHGISLSTWRVVS